MGGLAIFSAILGLSPPWQVISVGFDGKTNRIDIGVEFDRGRALICPICEATGAGEPQSETWYHDDFLNYAAYLHARMPTIACRCGVCPVERPWCRAGSMFARISESPGEIAAAHPGSR